jgi:hypothetical protein
VNAPVWVVELAAAFWQLAQRDEPFPRSLRPSIARALPLTVATLPRLTIQAAAQWLQNCGVACPLPGKDRALRACLVAYRGHGVVLLDGTDDDCEQRFSLAHELAHFLRHYWDIRRKICARLGDTALEVLDGQRPPTLQERMHALLKNVPLGFHLHLMERDSAGGPTKFTVAEAEDDADRLAYELLAPVEAIGATHKRRDRRGLTEALTDTYGLPELQAQQYAEILLPTLHREPLLLRLRNLR